MGGWVSGALSMAQRNMALGRDSMTTASTSMTSSLTFLTRSLRFLRSFPWARAAFFPKRAVDEVELSVVVVEAVEAVEAVECLAKVEAKVLTVLVLEEGPTVKAWVFPKKRMKEMQMKRKDFMVFFVDLS